MKTQRETERRTQCEGRGGDWSYATTSKGTPEITGSHQKLWERYRTNSFSEPLEGTNPGDILILNLCDC